ncbi:ABC transporter substrate-binding protein [Tessaracoccus palaemonis]|nr:iron-siderophore ABC transporter substrate-binding protein [Tessaracoccus palaemonis]
MSLPRSLHRLLVLVAAAAALTGAACTQQSTGAAAPATATRTVENIDGSTVEVPEHPQRVVTLSEPTTDGVLALGVTPVGVVSGRGQSTVSSYLTDKAADVPILGGVAQPNFEAIGKAAPDVILVDGTSIALDDAAIDTLSHIAPTVYTGYAGGDWRTNFTLVADALNLADEGAEVLSEYDGHAETVGSELAAAGLDEDTFSIVRWEGTSPSLILKELPPGQALTDLGLSRPANQDKRGRGHSEPVSLENLDQIDADWIFFGTLGGSSVANPNAGGDAGVEAAEQALATAAQTPGFTSLKAYQAGHIVPVDGSVWTSTGGPILMNAIVDQVQQALLTN